jgi:hypothetical protein
MAGSLDGDFDINGRAFHYEVVEIHDYEGRDWTGTDIEDHLEEADQVFYRATGPNDQDYWRWIGGPFEGMDQLIAAIEDEVDGYEEAA